MNFYGEIHNGKYVDEELREYFPDYNYKGIFFDVGAYHPIEISNSNHFYENGWNVYSFEAIPENSDRLKLFRDSDKVFNYAISCDDKDEIDFQVVETKPGFTASFSSIDVNDEYKNIFGFDDKWLSKKIKINQRCLNTIIKEYIPELNRIDILSIDVEGNELNCLMGIDLNKFKPKVIVLEDVTMTNKFYTYLSKFNYKFHKNNNYNYYFISDDFYLKSI